MISILLVSSHVNFLSGFESIDGKRADIEISRTGSGQEALEYISKQPFHLVVVDEALSDMAGLALVEKIVLTHPMINCAAASRLAGHEFHEASEGLGILMQLPLEPTEGHVKDLLDRLEQILKLNRSGARIP